MASPKVLLEVEDVAQVGAAPLVDRLIGIADDAEVAVDLGEPADQQVLRPVGVLVLVDHHEAELLGVLRPDRRRLLEQVDGLQQQVVEVERAALLQRVQVVGVDLGDLLVAPVVAGAGGHRVRALHPVLGAADARQRRARLDEAVVDVQLLERLLDDGELIGRVVDDEVARQADRRRLAAQQPGAQRVERRDPHAGCSPTPSSDSTRARISSAALLVKVTASTSCGLAWPSPTR